MMLENVDLIWSHCISQYIIDR